MLAISYLKLSVHDQVLFMLKTSWFQGITPINTTNTSVALFHTFHTKKWWHLSTHDPNFFLNQRTCVANPLSAAHGCNRWRKMVSTYEKCDFHISISNIFHFIPQFWESTHVHSITEMSILYNGESDNNNLKMYVLYLPVSCPS